MNNFTLFDLSVMANAIEQQRKKVTQEYGDRMQALDRIFVKIRNQIDVLEQKKRDELAERSFFDE